MTQYSRCGICHVKEEKLGKIRVRSHLLLHLIRIVAVSDPAQHQFSRVAIPLSMERVNTFPATRTCGT